MWSQVIVVYVSFFHQSYSRHCCTAVFSNDGKYSNTLPNDEFQQLKQDHTVAQQWVAAVGIMVSREKRETETEMDGSLRHSPLTLEHEEHLIMDVWHHILFITWILIDK
jgi:hypothetical protein